MLLNQKFSAQKKKILTKVCILTIVAIKTHPILENNVFKFDKYVRQRITPNMQWADLISPIRLIYNYKFMLETKR